MIHGLTPLLDGFGPTGGGHLRGGFRVLVKSKIHFRPQRGETLDNGAANPARPTGDNHHLSRKFLA